jgi:Regulator of chromosome condensation (RCC1) repeat/IPT/TIG domain/Putative Ig domain
MTAMPAARTRQLRLLVGSLGCLLAISAVTATSSAAAVSRKPGPAVVALSTTTAATAGGVRLTLRGSRFSHVKRVMFGGAVAHGLHVTSSHLLSVTVPRHKAGLVTVQVVTSAGKSAAVRAARFTFVAPPSVIALSVGQGATAGGTLVTVHGKDFLHVKQVLFGSVAGSQLHVLSKAALTVVSPRQSDGVADVRVLTSYGHSAVSAVDRFSYISPPLVVTTGSLPAATRAVGYTASLSASGGFGAYAWSAQGLPLGLSLSAGGDLRGVTYLAAGSYPVTLAVADQAGHVASASGALVVSRHAGSPVAWGVNTDGQVGDGSLTEQPLPVPVYGLADVVSVVSGDSNGYALKADGTVWAWGDNELDQIGDGTATTRLTPVQVPGLSGVVAIAAGEYSGFALTAAGTVWAWGYNGAGELGDGTTTSRPSPVQVTGLSGIVAIAASRATAYAVDGGGHVYAWGYNGQGELGDGTITSRSLPGLVSAIGGVSSVTAYDSCAYALETDGTVYAWGDNSSGGIGLGAVASVSTPEQVPGLTRVVALAGQQVNGFALLSDGTVKGWGLNTLGQVGDGSTVTRTSPVALTALHGVVELAPFAAMLSDGSVAAWGMNNFTDLANGGPQPTPVAVSLLKGVTGLTFSGGAYYGIR